MSSALGKLQYYLENHGQLVLLPEGKVLVGRGIECGIRFNDMSVSRRHLVLEVQPDRVIATDAGSRNGTRINGQRLNGPSVLEHGDILQIGRTFARIERQADTESERSTPPAGQPILGRVLVAPPISPEALDQIGNICPSCRAVSEENADVCGKCGYRWRTRPANVTQEIIDIPTERRIEPRLDVDVPVLYESNFLAFDAKAIDLSRGGLFVESDLLDPMGTECRVVLLPDGQPAVAIEGTVCHVRKAAESNRKRTGMGVRFRNISESAARWLGCTLASIQHSANETQSP